MKRIKTGIVALSLIISTTYSKPASADMFGGDGVPRNARV